MANNLDDQFGRPPIKDPDGMFKTNSLALCWVAGYIAASISKDERNCPYTTHYLSVYWNRGYDAKILEKKSTSVKNK